MLKVFILYDNLSNAKIISAKWYLTDQIILIMCHLKYAQQYAYYYL